MDLKLRMTALNNFCELFGYIYDEENGVDTRSITPIRHLHQYIRLEHNFHSAYIVLSSKLRRCFRMGKDQGGEYGYNGGGSWFALLVVLFILLIIVGAYYFSNGYGY